MYLEVTDLCKSYGEGGSYTQVLKNVSLEVQQGDMCVIQGTSGSGKSTLLNCIGGLDTVDSGSITVGGKELVGLNHHDRTPAQDGAPCRPDFGGGPWPHRAAGYPRTADRTARHLRRFCRRTQAGCQLEAVTAIFPVPKKQVRSAERTCFFAILFFTFPGSVCR